MLPPSGGLQIALDAERSCFGDEFINAPFFLSRDQEPPRGNTNLAGWAHLTFGQPERKRVEFHLDFEAVGTDEELRWGGGQRYSLQRNRLQPMLFHPGGGEALTGGTLDLESGEVEPGSLRVSAAFKNSVIGAVGALNRLPFVFPFMYPMPAIPDRHRSPAYMQAREELCELEFEYDTVGQIVGLALRGETNMPVTEFADSGFFPPFSFGRGSKFFFSHPTSCAPRVAVSECPSCDDLPDGLHLPYPAFFHPHLSLVSRACRPAEPALPTMTEQPAGNGGAAGSALGGRLLLFGGGREGEVSRRALAYEPAGGRWEILPDLPHAVRDAVAVRVGDEIFVCGGSDAAGRATDVVQVLHTDHRSWRLAAPLPRGVQRACAAELGGALLVAGGYEGTARTPAATLQIYDPARDAWGLGPELPLAVGGAAAAVVGGRLYVINGRDREGGVSDRVSVYAPEAGGWEAGPPTPIGVSAAAAATIDSVLYLVGGEAGPGRVAMRCLQQLDPARGGWRLGPEPFAGTSSAAAAVVGGDLVVAWGRRGGSEGPTERSCDFVQAFSPFLGWRNLSRSPAIDPDDAFNVGAGCLDPRRLSPGARAVLVGRGRPRNQMGSAGGLEEADVLVDGERAEIVSARADAVELVVPELAGAVGKASCAVEIRTPGCPPVRFDLPFAAVAPNVLTMSFAALDPTALREPEYLRRASALAANGDGTLNCPNWPELPGGSVAVALSGLGSGRVRRRDGIEATIDGRPAEIAAVMPLPGRRGVWLATIEIPAGLDLDSGLHDLRLWVADAEANPATIAVAAEAPRGGAVSFDDAAIAVLGMPVSALGD